VILCLLGILVLATVGHAEPPAGTFSIAAHDPVTGELGVAVQSRAFSVGAGVPWAEAGVGAIATQASTNESFGPRGLVLLRDGLPAEVVLGQLLMSDPGHDQRQLGIVDASGGSAAHTGRQCLDWAGDSTEVGLSVQGNILTGPEVVAAMVHAFRATEGELAEKLIAALEAGQAAGGDRRGQQSAALLVVRESNEFPEYRTRYVDLRVEDHPSPIAELRRVFEIHRATDLLEAHLRFHAAYLADGDSVAARRELVHVGAALRVALANPDAAASTLNALAWVSATADVFLDEALAAAERAVRLAPDDAGIIDTLAEVHFRRGDRDRAVEVIDRAIALDPEVAYYREQRARFLDDETGPGGGTP
jgi:uncharacterized Ntn-hydrolase superfamily protein